MNYYYNCPWRNTSSVCLYPACGCFGGSRVDIMQPMPEVQSTMTDKPTSEQDRPYAWTDNLHLMTEALQPFSRFKEANGQVAIATQYLYPSNGSVTVFVSGGPSGSVVSDEGGALDVLSSHGRSVDEPDHYLYRFCKPNGLKAKRGKIFSPIVPLEGLRAAIVFVANASAAAAHWGVDNIKPAVTAAGMDTVGYADVTVDEICAVLHNAMDDMGDALYGAQALLAQFNITRKV